MSSENTVEAVTVTIKTKGSHDATWHVFKGATVGQLRDDVIEFYGMDRASVSTWTTSELVAWATKVAQGTAQVVVDLGAKPAGESAPADQPAPDNAPPWDVPSEPAAPADPNLEHLTAIEAQTDVTALRVYWGKHQAVFAGNDVLTAAYKAKGKALTAATAA